MKLKVQETALLGGRGLKNPTFLLAVFFYHTTFSHCSFLPFSYSLTAPGASSHKGKTQEVVFSRLLNTFKQSPAVIQAEKHNINKCE